MYCLIHKDENFIVVFKESGVLSVKGRGLLEKSPNLKEELARKYGEIYVVHRIDKDTSGLLIFARNKETHRDLSLLFENRKVLKQYYALVFGNVANKNFIIDKPLKQFGSGRVAVSDNGKKSVTRVELVKRFEGYSLLKVYPITGRRHQIRVHLYSISHPVVGDRLYGDLNVQKKFKRLMLNCYKLEFEIYGKHYSFSYADKEFEEEINRICGETFLT